MVWVVLALAAMMSVVEEVVETRKFVCTSVHPQERVEERRRGKRQNRRGNFKRVTTRLFRQAYYYNVNFRVTNESK